MFIIVAIRLYQQGLVQALSSDERFRVVGVAARLHEAMERLTRMVPRPRVVLLDVAAGPGLTGARALHDALPDIPLVALSVDDTDDDVVACAETGVAGFVTTETSLEGLMATVLAVADGGARCSPRATAALMRRIAALAERQPVERPRRRLTPREREIVALIDRGLSNKQIGSELQIELATVKNHVHSILEKLSVERRGAAAAALRGHAGGGV